MHFSEFSVVDFDILILRAEAAMKKNITHIIYHLSVIVLSAGVALSLPTIITYVTRKVLTYWSFVENEELFLVSTEIAAAIILIVLVNAIVRQWKTRRLSCLAETAGLVAAAPTAALLAKRQVKKLKEEQGAGRSVMLIGSTGLTPLRTLTGDLHGVSKLPRSEDHAARSAERRGDRARKESWRARYYT
jgi:hypothetical protein